MAPQTNEQIKAFIEKFGEIQQDGFFACPRCGRMAMNEKPVRNALSRYAKVYICDECGTDEALRDFARCPLPLSEWSLAQSLK